MSDDSKRRRGRPALHQNGGSLLVRAPSKPGDELQGGWTREQLLRMDDCPVVAVEAPIKLGLENRASASAVAREIRHQQADVASLDIMRIARRRTATRRRARLRRWKFAKSAGGDEHELRQEPQRP